MFIAVEVHGWLLGLAWGGGWREGYPWQDLGFPQGKTANLGKGCFLGVAAAPFPNLFFSGHLSKPTFFTANWTGELGGKV